MGSLGLAGRVAVNEGWLGKKKKPASQPRLLDLYSTTALGILQPPWGPSSGERMRYTALPLRLSSHQAQEAMGIEGH